MPLWNEKHVMDFILNEHPPPAPCSSLHIPIQVREVHTSQKKEGTNSFQQQTKNTKMVGNMGRIVHSAFRCGVCFTG